MLSSNPTEYLSTYTSDSSHVLSSRQLQASFKDMYTSLWAAAVPEHALICSITKQQSSKQAPDLAFFKALCHCQPLALLDLSARARSLVSHSSYGLQLRYILCMHMQHDKTVVNLAYLGFFMCIVSQPAIGFPEIIKDVHAPLRAAGLQHNGGSRIHF